MNTVLPLTADTTLAEVGGKALSLGRLLRAGFPVPPGVVLTTSAYRAYVTEHGLAAVIADALTDVDPADHAALADASTRIRAAFADGRPTRLLATLRPALGELLDRPLAVRSSATAEDLPDLSFAGQQDTFLNVRGPEALRAAIVSCWSSLWTARAIAYRLSHGLADAEVELAVVLQELVPADVSGVLFTANPLTGRRRELVIDATPGLGEALVSGQVEPDQFVVDRAGRVRSQTLGAKSHRTVANRDGGVDTIAATETSGSCLSPAELRTLAGLGGAIEDLCREPQDVEWAIDGDGAPWIVQARPITSLFPVPADVPEDSLWLSFGAVQGVLDPLTPLGQDALLQLFVGLAHFFDLPTDGHTVGFIRPAGDRLWIRMDGLLRTRVGRALLPRILAMVEPGVAATVAELVTDAAPAGTGVRWGTVRRAGRLIAPILRRVPQLVVDPSSYRHTLTGVAEQFEQAVATEFAAAALAPDPRTRLSARVAAIRHSMRAGLPTLLPRFAPIMGPSLPMVQLLRSLAEPLGEEGARLSLEALRALDGNVTAAMDVALWDVAEMVRGDRATSERLRAGEIEDVAADWLAGRLPAPIQESLTDFMQRYGMRAVAEIDLGRPRWREEPAAVLRSLAAFLADRGQGPEAGLAAGRAAARSAIVELARRLGPVRGTQARFLARTLRGLLGARETPKFTLVQALGHAREALLDSGRDLVGEGVLERPGDIAYLTLCELEHLDQRPADAWRATITKRVQAASHHRRRHVPRVLAGDGRAFFEGIGDTDGVITGSPVSPGVVEGVVRVMFDPATATLEAGEILVCPGTDPAWTPLFLTAGGLITEVGGLMTHGSVVAREHGLPAVVGVHDATKRFRTGQRIRLDGTSGRIHAVEPSSADEAVG
ncbi:PEP/pyruvate-binding domain-containing protein [Granulicoccus sp. GXG6511]|uniref:PEP/pyruvate-binding domain-containing protein n=1 Tax=Granulicoccus sp. GXG6511 TaxID=3381351 RepID=UPI003D7DEDA5